MGIYKTKYSSMPDNSYFDRRMVNGDSLTDIFDDTDIFSLAYKEAKDRPVKVRVGERFNYVANNYILFDNWFVSGASFDLNDKCSFAYRRYNERGIREGGVLIRSDGSYVTREEFLDIQFGLVNYHGKYAIVKQSDGLLNIVDVEKGIKIDKTGIKADCLTYADNNFIDSGMFAVAVGNLEGIRDLDWFFTMCGEKIAKEKQLKCNFYSVDDGLLSPTLWFDYVEPFRVTSVNYIYRMSNHAIVHLNGKKNFINKRGELLSEVWFDNAIEKNRDNGWIGEAGIIKSESVKDLYDYDDYYNLNPDKYNIYKIDKYGGIKKT